MTTHTKKHERGASAVEFSAPKAQISPKPERRRSAPFIFGSKVEDVSQHLHRKIVDILDRETIHTLSRRGRKDDLTVIIAADSVLRENCRSDLHAGHLPELCYSGQEKQLRGRSVRTVSRGQIARYVYLDSGAT